MSQTFNKANQIFFISFRVTSRVQYFYSKNCGWTKCYKKFPNIWYCRAGDIKISQHFILFFRAGEIYVRPLRLIEIMLFQIKEVLDKYIK